MGSTHQSKHGYEDNDVNDRNGVIWVPKDYRNALKLRCLLAAAISLDTFIHSSL